MKRLCVLSRSFPKLPKGGGQTRELLGAGFVPSTDKDTFLKADNLGQYIWSGAREVRPPAWTAATTWVGKRGTVPAGARSQREQSAQYPQLSISTDSKGSFQLAQNWLLVARRQRGASRDASFLLHTLAGFSSGWHILTHLKTVPT